MTTLEGNLLLKMIWKLCVSSHFLETIGIPRVGESLNEIVRDQNAGLDKFWQNTFVCHSNLDRGGQEIFPI